MRKEIGMGTQILPSQLSQRFQNGEVLTSSELIAHLTKSGESDQNARQIIGRLAKAGTIWRSSDLRLPRNERLFAAAPFRSDPDFIAAVGKKLQGTSRHGLARCLSVLGTRFVLNKVDALRLLAVSPTRDANGREQRRLYESELAGLLELGVEVIHEGTALEALRLSNAPDHINADEAALRAAQNLRKEALLARVLIERMRQQNILAWNQVEVADTATPYVAFNGQVFTASGFCYLAPLVRWSSQKKPIPCPVVVDCYHDRCTVSQVSSFSQRLGRASNRGKSTMKVLGIVAAREFDREAWDEAKRLGFMAINLRQTFGNEALDLMAQIEEVVQDVVQGAKAKGPKAKFGEFARMIIDLKTNPIVTTIRSIGFEALAGLVLGSQGYNTRLELGRVVPWENTKRDVDVFGIRGDELRIIECKAHHRRRSLTPDEIKKFFTETVPALKRWLRDNQQPFTSCVAEIWTTGPKGHDAGDTLHKLDRPKADQWGVARIQEITKLLPASIKNRALELLNSIATADENTIDEDGMLDDEE
jgi:hypothetical protein